MSRQDDTMGKAALALLLAVPVAILYGLVVTVLWRWFVVTTFQLPPLTVAQAIGLSLVVALFSSGGRDDRSALEALFASVVKALVALALGWIVQLWV